MRKLLCIPLITTGTVTSDCADATMGSAARLAFVRKCILATVEIEYEHARQCFCRTTGRENQLKNEEGLRILA
jgi:hypothetical protein